MRYSPKTNGFYPEDTEYHDLPDDIIVINDALYQQLKGQSIEMGSDGMPRILIPPVPTHEQYIAGANAEKLRRIETAHQSVSLLQLKLQAGRTLTDAEVVRLNAVLDYIDEVEAVNTSSAPHINWPHAPGV